MKKIFKLFALFILFNLFFLCSYKTAKAMIPPPASRFMLFFATPNPPPFPPLVFQGNIFSPDLSDLVSTPLRAIQGNGIVGTTGNTPVFGKYRIGNYVMNSFNQWSEVTNKVAYNSDSIVKRLKKYAKDCPTTGYGILPFHWHMNLSDAKFDLTNAPPEGNLYYCEGGDFIEVYGTLNSTSAGRATIIFKDVNVRLHGDIGYQDNQSLGIIVIGRNLVVENDRSGMKNLRGAYFSTNDITFTNDPITQFKGFLAGSTIKLPQSGTFSYDPRIASNPPPGFREIFKALYKEAAP
ncbi:MAG: hypothetical protein NT135_00255 [Candidatus Berkelbacteria bacterium]|nr:hypothetical protein [Candidatus Berkelbacteria bacterium]